MAHESAAVLSKLRKASFYSLSALLLSAAVLAGLRPGLAHAGTLSESFVRFDRLAASANTTGTVCAKPATTATEASVQVVFPTGYTLGTSGTFTVTTTNLSWPSGASAWPSIGTATNVTSQTVTFPSGDLTVGTLYCFNWNSASAVQVKASASSNNTGSITTQTSAPATIDTASYSTVSLTGDQISVTASVPQSFTFALSGNTDALGNLSTGSVISSPTPRTVTVNTNAANGWFVYAQDANTGLKSPSTNYTIASTTPGSNSTQTIGNEGFNLGVTQSQTSGSGTPSVPAAFDGSIANHGGGLDGTLRLITSSGGTANNAVMTLKNNVAISSLTTAAADYADTETVVGAAAF